MGMCFVPGCKHYSSKHACRFFRIPKNQTERNKWISLIGRKDREPSPYAKVCDCHFVDKEKKNRPTLFDLNIQEKFNVVESSELRSEPDDCTPIDSDSNNEEFLIDESSVEPDESDPELRVGLFTEPFEELRQISENNKETGLPTLCALLIDETQLAQKYEKFKDKMWGYTEGMGKKPLNEPKKMASKAVVFMVISLTANWKIPIGLFFVHNPDIKYFADTIEEALSRLDEINIDIISITLNCVSPHLSFALAEELGAEIDLSNSTRDGVMPSFNHPTNGKSVYIIYDLEITLGYLKNYWATERALIYKTKNIMYFFVSNVRKIDETEMNSYGMDSVYDWVIIRKRLSYDPESISKTTADALQYLNELGHPDVALCEGTIQFLRVLDLISQLASASEEGQLFGNISEENEDQWKPIIINLLNYVVQLKTNSKKDTPEHLSALRIYITGLMVSFTSILKIYYTHIKKNENNETKLQSLSPYKIGLKNIRLGLFEDWRCGDMTALYMFKKMRSLIESVHPINTA